MIGSECGIRRENKVKQWLYKVWNFNGSVHLPKTNIPRVQLHSTDNKKTK